MKIFKSFSELPITVLGKKSKHLISCLSDNLPSPQGRFWVTSRQLSDALVLMS